MTVDTELTRKRFVGDARAELASLTGCDSCSATAVYHLLAEDDEGYVCARHFDEYEVHVRFDSYARVSV